MSAVQEYARGDTLVEAITRQLDQLPVKFQLEIVNRLMERYYGHGRRYRTTSYYADDYD